MARPGQAAQLSCGCRRGMFTGGSGASDRKPLVSYSEDQARATLVSHGSTRMPKRRRVAATGARRRRRSVGRASGSRRRSVGGRRKAASQVKVVRGKISYKIAGMPRFRRIAASKIVRNLPKVQINAAVTRAVGGVYRRRRRVRGTGQRRYRRRSLGAGIL